MTLFKVKRTDLRLGRCSTVADVWCWLTAEEAEAVAGLVAADVLAVRQWWLDERWLVVVCQLVKMVCGSVGSSALRVCFQRSLTFLICCVDFLHL